MILCAAGDIHGALDRLYADVLALEQTLAVRFDWVLHVGDFGVWPDPAHVDAATRRHDGAGDFPAWWVARRAAPRRTLFIKGNHEDFAWLDAQPDPEVLPGLVYLPNGRTFSLDAGAETLCVGGLGGCYGPSDYERPSRQLQGAARRHYTRDEIDTLSSTAGLDILLTHDAPAGVRFEKHRHGEPVVSYSEAAGLDELVARTQPRVCFFGHHHARVDAEIAGVRCIGLHKIARPGNLVAFEMHSGGGPWRVLGESGPPCVGVRPSSSP
jgi:predicted phosphodiesterase